MATGFTYRHYILKDHLGSWSTITDAQGNVEQELSFDAWGNLRDPETWVNYMEGEEHETPMFDRGFTGHEHLYAFGLINMNGRMYDPVMSSFLSVDAYVQSPDNSQNFNRYAYCLNNPLRYTDPTGWYCQGWHTGTPAQGPYECQWNSPLEPRDLGMHQLPDIPNPDILWMEANDQKGGGGITIVGNDGSKTKYSPGMTYKGNDQFTKDAVNSLNDIFSNGGEEGKTLISSLSSNSKFVFLIVDISEGSSEFIPDDRFSGYHCLHANVWEENGATDMFLSLHEYDCGTGGTIQWNRNQEYMSIDGCVQNSTFVLTHELCHAYDASYGLMDDGCPDNSGLKYNEWSACYQSNIIAINMGIPIQTYYSGKGASFIRDVGKMDGPWYKVVDNNNYPIYKNRYIK